MTKTENILRTVKKMAKLKTNEMKKKKNKKL